MADMPLAGVADPLPRQDLLDELARLFAEQMRELIARDAAEHTAPPQVEKTPASSRNEPR